MSAPDRSGPRFVPAACLVLLLALPMLLSVPASEAATRRVLVIGSSTWIAPVEGNPPKVFDINKDGRKEIIVQSQDNRVHVFDSKTGARLFTAALPIPTGWGARSLNGPEAAVLVPGATTRLVVASSAAIIVSYRFDPGASTATKFAFVKEWQRRLNDCHSNPGMDAKPVVADLDRDGKLEIIGATEEVGVIALRYDGKLMWKACIGGGNAEPAVGDLDRDGWPEVVFGSDGGTLRAMHGRWGTSKWSFYVPGRFNVGAGSMPVGATVAQLDGVGGPDVVVGVRDSHDRTDWSKDHALLLALDSNGKLLWGRRHPEANPLTYTRPVVVDADKDGKREVYWGDWNTNGHKPPDDPAQAWKRLGPAHFFRYDAAGTLVWKQDLPTWWSNKDIALADVDRDGVQEVLANGPNAGHDGIWYLNGKTGARETFVDASPWKAVRGPIVADLWGTGTMQLVLPASALDDSRGAVIVYDTGQPYDSAWPHVPYRSAS